MAISMYKISVPIFVQHLTALSNVLDKTAAHAEAKQLDVSFLLGMRLYPDMYPLSRQVQQATAHAMRACSALAGADGTEDKDITLKLGANERKFTGQGLLLNHILPNFYFHCTTAYDIARHCGVELAKRDFMGTPVNL
jgi:uncharacterized protein